MAESELKKYYNLFVPSDMVGRVLQRQFNPNSVPESETHSIVKTLSQLIIDTKTGTHSTGFVAKTLNDYASKADEDAKKRLQKFIQVYSTDPEARLNQDAVSDSDRYEPDLVQSFKVTGDANFKGDKTAPHVSAICFDTPMISPATRNIDDVTLFLNVIPSVELAKCVPYLEVIFEFGRPPVDDNGKILAPSLYRFLLGSSQPATVDKSVLAAQSHFAKSGDSSAQQAQHTRVGMELFTSPRTLVNAEFDDSFGTHSQEILDKFRPFMSIESFSYETTNTNEATGFKNAKMGIILHDRSRLADIADLVKPEVLGVKGTSLSITYGWSHPSLPGENAWGDLINAQRVTEIYVVINSSYSFDSAGQVKIELELSFNPGMEFIQSKITDSPNVSEAHKKVQEMREIIGQLRRQLNIKSPGGNSADVLAMRLIEAGAMGQFPNFSDKAKNANFNAALNQLKSLLSKDVKKNSDQLTAVQQLTEALKTMFGQDGKGGIMDKLKTTIADEIQQKFNRIELVNPDDTKKKNYTPPSKQPFEKIDPFLFSKGEEPTPRKDIFSDGVARKIKGLIGTSVKNNNEQVRIQVASLAKLLMLFAAEPIAAQASADEIQFLYYQANEFAGYTASTNLASFPIEIDRLKQIMQDQSEKKKTASFSVNEFVSLLQSHFMSDRRSIAYGLTDLYVARNSNALKTEPAKPDPKKARDKTNDTLTLAMHDKNDTWKAIDLGVYVEQLVMLNEREQGDDLTEAERTVRANQFNQPLSPKYKRITRIHVYDKNASPHQLNMHLLEQSTSRATSTISKFKQISPKLGKENPFAALAEVLKQSFELAKISLDENNKLNGTEESLIDYQSFIDALSTGNTDNILIYGGGRAFKRFLRASMPTLLYGSNNSLIKDASISANNNHLQSTVNMMSNTQAHLEPNGSGFGGLPLTIIPAQLEFTVFGCPTMHISQQFFIDFGTGTNIDNIYNVYKVSGEITPGKFETKLSFNQLSAYGAFQPIYTKIKTIIDELNSITKRLQGSST